MLIKKSINPYTGPVLATAVWFMTFNYQDWICATHWQELQQSVAQFDAQHGAPPPFGLWESIASSDFRLKNQLLSLYLDVGALERATFYAKEMLSALERQPQSEQMTFFQNCISLDAATDLQALAIKRLRFHDKANPVWMLHQHMLYQKRIPEIIALTSAEQEQLANYLSLIGEGEFASQIIRES